MKENQMTIFLLKRIIELSKTYKSLPTKINILKLKLLLNHHKLMGYINIEDYKNLIYFYKKLLTNNE